MRPAGGGVRSGGRRVRERREAFDRAHRADEPELCLSLGQAAPAAIDARILAHDRLERGPGLLRPALVEEELPGPQPIEDVGIGACEESARGVGRLGPARFGLCPS